MNPDRMEFSPEKAASFVIGHGHSGWLGLKFIAAGADWAELELPWRADLLGDEEREVLASGPIFSLLDMASGMAIWCSAGTFRPIATLDLRVDYQRPVRAHAAVTARVECYKHTRSAAFVRGIAHDGDPANPVANMAGVFMVLARPPKLSEHQDG